MDTLCNPLQMNSKTTCAMITLKTADQLPSCWPPYPFAVSMIPLKTADQLPGGWPPYPFTVSGYRVNYSLRESLLSLLVPSHNEFWMIWTDLLPLCIFLYTWAAFLPPTSSAHSCLKEAHWVFAAAVFCRACSFAYHTFNCLSLKVNRALACLDLVGIASNAWGVPWLNCLAYGSRERQQATGTYVLNVFMGAYALCLAAIVCSCYLSSTKNQPFFCRRMCSQIAVQGLLVILAFMGNMHTAYVLFTNPSQMHLPTTGAVRACLALGPALFAAGYVAFYVYRIPEAVLPPGLADGKVWNSHVLWHLASSMGQGSYLMAAILFHRSFDF